MNLSLYCGGKPRPHSKPNHRLTTADFRLQKSVGMIGICPNAGEFPLTSEFSNVPERDLEGTEQILAL